MLGKIPNKLNKRKLIREQLIKRKPIPTVRNKSGRYWSQSGRYLRYPGGLERNINLKIQNNTSNTSIWCSSAQLIYKVLKLIQYHFHKFSNFQFQCQSMIFMPCGVYGSNLCLFASTGWLISNSLVHPPTTVNPS